MDRSRELSTLVESSNLLLGIERPLSKLGKPVEPLPMNSPLTGRLGGMGDTTRMKRYVAQSDSGYGDSSRRFWSEWYPLAAPYCDTRDNGGVLGEASRLIGRDPVVKKASF